MDSGKHFNAGTFLSKMRRAQEHVRKILDTGRTAMVAADCPHTYHDKFSLAEFCAAMAHAAHTDVLVAMGLDLGAAKTKMKEWSIAGKSITLRLASKELCKFLREAQHTVESAKVKTKTKVLGITSTKETSVVSTVKDYFYEVTYEWEIFLFAGTTPEDKITLRSRRGSLGLRRSAKSAFRPASKTNSNIDVGLDGFFTLIPFSINRSASTCRTPRRNAEVERALGYFSSLFSWCGRADTFLRNMMQFEQNSRPSHNGFFAKRDLNAINTTGIFCPVLPLLENRPALSITDGSAAGADPAPKKVLSQQDFDAFQGEHRRTLDAKLKSLVATFPTGDKAAALLISATEATTRVLMAQMRNIVTSYKDAVGYIEYMLYSQLEAAVGKVVTAKDFNEYMAYHNKRLFLDAYSPRPFCYSIRRPDHYPEGLVTLEQASVDAPGGYAALPTMTCCLADDVPATMTFALNAATTVSMSGARYVHAAVLQTFTSSAPLPTLRLSARARQFSSFILMIGTLAPGNEFEPKHALIVKDKDDLAVPLMLETIPSPAEFRDAIESLSPEQQRFAKAYRSMQLASTLFAVAIVQIKPQLERLLGLPDDSLTKEIKLTQTLMDLFIKYQIPSDLISFDPANSVGGAQASVTAKLNAVKAHVKQIEGMLASMKVETLASSSLVAANAQMERLSGGGNAMFKSSRSKPMKKRSSKPMSASFSSFSSAPRAPPAMSAPRPAAAAMASTAPVPSPPPTTGKSKPQAKKQPQSQDEVMVKGTPATGGRDLTTIPNELDAKYLKLDLDGTLRPTVIKVHKHQNWTKRYQRNLLSKPETATLGKAELKNERDAAFDLLDALSRSGALDINCAELHVVVAATHRFARTVVDTVIMDNVNPIEKVERSVLIVGTTIHQQPDAGALLQPAHAQRVLGHSPQLFLTDSAESKAAE